MTQPEHSGLPPLPPQVLSRRRRQNRILVALLIMVVVPIVAFVGGRQAAKSVALQWAAHSAFPLNTPAVVHLDKPGDYVVWSTSASAVCAVGLDDQTLTLLPDEPDNVHETGYHPNLSFEAPEAGDYDVVCMSENPTGHVIVSTPFPNAEVSLLLLGGIGIAVVAGAVGLGLLLWGISKNRDEKDAERTGPQLATQPPVFLNQPATMSSPTMTSATRAAPYASPTATAPWPMPPANPQSPPNPYSPTAPGATPPASPPMPPAQAWAKGDPVEPSDSAPTGYPTPPSPPTSL
ncbi:MAG: hypothetical protein LBV06_06655 [Propionibacteriaceae bacterium]|jgi:hypothetical protein|nr:hypothetical protein [Propionibacteriaceae bacterium]